MLKGHVFKEQKFGNQIFALFINTFLNGKNGISNDYKNGMAITYSENTLTIQSGAICIQGRFLEEDTSTDIIAGTDTSYCKLVLEIDLSKQNTETEFNQASYKIVKSSSAYPSLTQTDIIKNNTGIYQYELARFKTGTNGITDFQDMRTFLNFDSIYEEIKKEIQNIKDGSIYVLKSDEVIIYEEENGTIENITLSESSSNFKKAKIDYNYDGVCDSVIIDNPNGKTVSLTVSFSIPQQNVSRTQYKTIKINDTTVSNSTFGYLAISNAGSVESNIAENAIKITKITGYRN